MCGCVLKTERNAEFRELFAFEVQFDDRCFATAGPTLWNSLPEQLRQPNITFGQFKR